MNPFNTRETAIIIWGSIFIIAMLCFTSVRRPTIKLLKSLFAKTFLKLFSLMTAYTLLVVVMLYKLSLWDFSLLKNTILWFIFVAIPTLFKINERKSNKNYLWEGIADNFKFTALLEFLVGLYTFSLGKELVFIPIITLVSVMQFISKKENRYYQVTRLLNSILIVGGIIILVNFFYHIIADFKSFAQKGTLSDFMISPALSALFIPFVYGFAMFIDYDSVFAVLPNALKDPKLVGFAKKQALLRFNFRTNALKRWRAHLFLNEIKTNHDVLTSIKQLKTLIQTEKNPPEILFETGWSPYKAKEFLTEKGIKTGYYQKLDDSEWFANSTYIPLDETFLPNNIAFYISGDKEISKELKLHLNMHAPELSVEAHLKMLEYSKALYFSALKKEMPDTIEQAIINGTKAKVQISNRHISVSRTSWEGHNKNGYSIDFVIKVEAEVHSPVTNEPAEIFP